MPEGYSGDGFLAMYYEIYYEGEDEILAVVDDSSDPSNLFLIDNGLIPSNSDEPSEYCYTIYAVNAQDLNNSIIDTTLTESELNYTDSINRLNELNNILISSRNMYNIGL